MNHQLKFALQNLKNSRFSAALNLFGLTSAITAVILIMLYVWNEYHFDSYNKNVEEIYRLEIKSPNSSKTSLFLFGPTGNTLTKAIPEIIKSTTFLPWGKWGEGVFKWDGPNGEIKNFEDYAFGDENLTSIFSFHFIMGNAINPLKEPQSAIVSESFAKKTWGNNNPIGKRIRFGTLDYSISGVFSDLEPNSIISCPIILRIPQKGWIADNANNWNITNYPQFILVKPGTDMILLNKKINNLAIIQSKYSFFNNGTEKASIIARPLKKVRFSNEMEETPIFTFNNKVFVDSLFWVGILILLVALVNFVNFASANIPKRIKSVSINRIIGFGRFHIIIQFVTETTILFSVSYVLALIIASYINRYASNELLGYTLSFSKNYLLLISIGFVCLFFGVVASLYPAFYATSVKPIESLKNFNPKRRINLRGILTISQFAATIALIAISFMVIKQVRYMKNADPGYNKNGTMVINLNRDLKSHSSSFINSLRKSPFIKDFAFSRTVPGIAMETTTFNVDGKNCPLWYWAVDDNYIKMMGFTILRGRNFLKDSYAERQNLICNETAARKYNWKLGTKVGEGILVGIIKDFNFISLKEQVEPFAFWYSNSPDVFESISIKLDPDNYNKAVAYVGKIYNEISPEIPFRYFFLDDRLNLLYYKENQQVMLIILFSFISVVISILGIFGLSTFMCQYKLKEIGIRKVNGARVTEILAMLNLDFIKWVIIAFIVASPVAWYAMNKWLQNFAYKTEVSWWVFVVAGAIALLIALITVSWQSWRAATRNPVEALRYE